MRVALPLVLFATLFYICNAISFDLHLDKERCLSEELSRDVLVVGTFSGPSPPQSVSTEFRILDPSSHELFNKHGESGKFAFTTAEGGEFQFCFIDIRRGEVHDESPRRVELKIKTGVEARDYSEVATKENLSQIQLIVRKMADEAEGILNEIRYMRKREERMRNTNESTNTRVAWLSVFSIVVLVALGVFQIFYLKRFFKSKRIVD
eukprot:TRINITY_DN242_c0_g1_i1.p1 TRINITY_DN242_c0_g1~~TRINITY_DN242_c0_g1_i1.p1  ORF type:complete len:207 (-),score=30.80 TRINITY_DN242_c0_g1_i1:55-675(-)